MISLFAFLLGAAQLIFLYNMVVSWRFGPRATGQPVAGEDDRVAGLLAAADRSTSTRSPASSAGPYEFGVPGARHAIMPATKRAPR